MGAGGRYGDWPREDNWAGDRNDNRDGAGPDDVYVDALLPRGQIYDWYRRGVELLETGNAAAAAQVLTSAAAAEPTSRSVREALARAQFDAGEYPEALASFAWLVSVSPSDDYAQFGWGLAAAKIGDLEQAVEHLALAAAMRPDVSSYSMALRGARAARGPSR